MQTRKTSAIRFLIINHYDCRNKGDHSVLSAMLETIRETFVDPQITILSHHPELDKTRCDERILESIIAPSPGFSGKLQAFSNMLRCMIWGLLYRCFKISINDTVPIAKRESLAAYSETDIVLARSIDWFNDVYGFKTFITVYYEVLMSILLGKKTVIYAQTIGPFKTNFKGKLYRTFLRMLFKRISLITVRDKNSKKFLDSIGIIKRVYLTADPAFLLKPVSEERAKASLLEDGILREPGRIEVGINVSQLGYRYSFDEVKNLDQKYLTYKHLMADFIDHITKSMDASVILVPHVFGPDSMDDRIVAKEIFELVKSREHLAILSAEHNPAEIRGIIGQMDVFIGMRMHSIIHSLSEAVPTIAIDYMGKTEGVMEQVSMTQMVVYSSNLDFSILLKKLTVALANRQTIHESLLNNMTSVRERSLQNIVLLKELINGDMT